MYKYFYFLLIFYSLKSDPLKLSGNFVFQEMHTKLSVKKKWNTIQTHQNLTNTSKSNKQIKI